MSLVGWSWLVCCCLVVLVSGVLDLGVLRGEGGVEVCGIVVVLGE